MTKEDFCRILGEFGVTAEEQEDIWRTRPTTEELTEEKLREACRRLMPELPDIRAQSALTQALSRYQEECQGKD